MNDFVASKKVKNFRLFVAQKKSDKKFSFLFFLLRPLKRFGSNLGFLEKKTLDGKRHQRYRLKILPPASPSFFLRKKKRRFHGLIGCDR